MVRVHGPGQAHVCALLTATPAFCPAPRGPGGLLSSVSPSLLSRPPAQGPLVLTGCEDYLGLCEQGAQGPGLSVALAQVSQHGAQATVGRSPRV